MNILGIDIGSSYIKAGVISTDRGVMLQQTNYPSLTKLSHADPLIYEIDADELYHIIEEIIKATADSFSLGGIIFSTQMHGFIYQTKSRPDRYISWQDSRCTAQDEQGVSPLDKVKKLITKEDSETLGVQIKPSLGMCNLYALLHNADAPAADGTLFTLGSYLIWRLTGNNICHITNAAPLGLVNVPEKSWNKTVINALDFARISLPLIASEEFQPAGYCLAKEQRIPVYPDYGDQQVSIAGACASTDDAVINIATACQLSRNTENYIPGPYEIRPYFERSYINTISNMPGGRNLAVLIQFFKEGIQLFTGQKIAERELWDTISKTLPAEAEGLKTELYFYPTNEHLQGGSISHIQPHNFHVSNLFQASYEHMADEYSKNLPLLENDSAIKQLIFSGGVSWKNPYLIETAARRIGLPYKRSPIPDETFNGLYRISLAIERKGGLPDASLKRTLE
jgi:sugar (pentulose or hexulose) kinase